MEDNLRLISKLLSGSQARLEIILESCLVHKMVLHSFALVILNAELSSFPYKCIALLWLEKERIE